MQYFFVELQRAKRSIIIAAILVALFLVTAIIIRLSLHTGHWQTELQNSPTAHVTRTQLADGSTRAVVDDAARQTHAVIVSHPDGSLDMVVTEPNTDPRHPENFDLGSMNMNSTVQGNVRRTTVHWKQEMPTYELGALFLFTIPMGLIVASLLGGALAKENDGHLELAWTKPVPREKYAVASLVVDAGAIIISQLLCVGVTLLATLMFFVPRFVWPADTGWHILTALAGPIAWYALITAASASLKRGPGAVIGLGWVAALIVPSVAEVLQGAAQVNGIAAAFYAVFHALSYLDPISYFAHNGSSRFISLQGGAGVLCALVLGYSILAVAQWRRVEA